MGRVRSRMVAIAALLAAACMWGCTDAPASPTSTAPFSQTDLIVGTGADAVTGAQVTVNYTGWLYDPSKTDQKGQQFETSIGKTPFSFSLGFGQVIQGWETGVPGMKVGGRRRLVIPPSQAYGDTRKGIIPPNSTLVFEIDLVSVP